MVVTLQLLASLSPAVLVRRPAILIELFREFSQSIQENVGVMP
jgi:hypothetical protein